MFKKTYGSMLELCDDLYNFHSKHEDSIYKGLTRRDFFLNITGEYKALIEPSKLGISV